MTRQVNFRERKQLEDISYALNESVIVSITDTKGTILFANEKFCRQSQYAKEELIGQNQRIVNSNYHSREFFKEMWRTIGKGGIWRGEIRNQAKDGSYYWVHTTIVPFLNEENKPYQYISIRYDITDRKEYEEAVRKIAYHDPLTGLPNRNYLIEWLKHEKISKQHAFTVLFLNIDRIKTINDTHGHYVGDLIIKQATKRMLACLDLPNMLLRQGGDEWIVLLNDVHDHQDIMEAIDCVMEQFEVPFLNKGKQIHATTSIGVSTNELTEDQVPFDLIERTIREAETAMYHAKNNGGNTYCFNTKAQNIAQQRFYELEHELVHAFAKGEFYLVYQPVICLKEDKISGFETLIRWENARLGMVRPDEFIPIIEQSGLIIPIGKWVLRQACMQMKMWQDDGVSIDRIAVNVSPIQFRDQTFLKDVETILAETGLDAKRLELEITEGTLLNIEKPDETLQKLREIGVSISIDDFGTGYSSLSYLKMLPIQTIKIDKSFIHDLDEQDEVLVDTIISLGKNLNFNVIAEGVENRNQLHYLSEHLCDEGQGFFWSRPVKPEEINEAYLEKLINKT